MSEPWETVKEASWRLNVSRRTIRKWASRGKIPVHRMNARVIYYDLSHPPALYAGRPPRLTPDDVRRIRDLRGERNGSIIARLFGVTPWTIYLIWKDRIHSQAESRLNAP